MKRELYIFINSNRIRIAIYIALLLLTILTRFNDLATDSNSWDEATFILIAKDVLRGHLPYVVELDNKPPMLFFLLAGVQFVFGESLLVIRLFGDVCIAGTAILCFELAQRKAGVRPALFGALTVVAINSLDFARTTQSEQIAMLFVMAAMFCALRLRPSNLSAALAGFCIALAVLTRSNLVLAAAAMGIFFALPLIENRDRFAFQRLALYVAGGLSPLAVIISLYAINAELPYLQLALIEVPANYAAERSAGRVLLSHGHQFALAVLDHPFFLVPFVVLAVIGFSIMLLSLFRNGFRGSKGDKESLLTILLLAGTAASITVGGVAYPHYWLQVVPFCAIAIAGAVEHLRKARFGRGTATAFAAVPMMAALVANAPESIHTALHLREIEVAYPLKRAADLIRAERRPGERVWTVQGHLVHWYLDEDPISPAAAHPANLVRQSIISTLERAGYVPKHSFDRILESKPAFVIQAASDVPYYLKKHPEKYLDWRRKNYRLWASDPDYKIFVSKDR